MKPLHSQIHTATAISTSLHPTFRNQFTPNMQSWKNFTAQLPPVDVSGLSKNLRNTVQATRYVNINRAGRSA